MSREVYVLERRKDKSGWVVLIGAAAMIAFWKWILLGCTIYGLGLLIHRGYLANKAHRDKQISRNAALALRAERENALWNQAGLYEGEYPGATMPITQTQYNELQLPTLVMDPYDSLWARNYDDGLKEWK